MRPSTGPNGYNTGMNIKTRIATAADKLRRSGGHPQQVHLTTDDAVQLQYQMMSEGGEFAHAIMRDGIRSNHRPFNFPLH
jgi:hypothetical protein